jgi:hypothetical protein
MRQDLEVVGLVNDILQEEMRSVTSFNIPAVLILQPKTGAIALGELTKKQLPSDVKLKVAVSETPNSWAEYEDD